MPSHYDSAARGWGARRICSRTGLIAGILALSLTAIGCVDPDKRFDQFNKRIPDAAPEPDAAILLNIPDISGHFLIALASVVDPDRPILFIAENDLTANQDGSVTLDTTITPLHKVSKQLVGDPLVFENVPVSQTGQYTLTRDDLVITGAANPISSNDLVASTVSFHATIRTADIYCGTVTGMLTSPLMISLDNSTFGAIRIAPGTIGDDLPEPVSVCPPDTTMPDAGVPDAGVTDAQVTDASADANSGS